MFLNEDQNNYFIAQVGAAALALGVEEADVATIGGLLDSVFNRRCTPPLTTEDGVPLVLVGTNPSLCHAESCEVVDADFCPGMDTMPPTMAPMDMDTMPPTMDPSMPSASVRAFGGYMGTTLLVVFSGSVSLFL